MKDLVAKSLFFFIDFITIILSISLAYNLCRLCRHEIVRIPLESYLHLYPIYLSILGFFLYEGLYKRRYDLWHESRLILRCLTLSFLILFSYLALTHQITHYSRGVIVLAYLIMGFMIPLVKREAKITLKRIGLWGKPAIVYGEDPQLRKEIYENPYLGYRRELKNTKNATLFINANSMHPFKLRRLIEEELHNREEILFVPLLNDFDLTHAQIYEMANARSNLISLQNRLHNRYYRWIKGLSDYLLLTFSLPFILPIMGLIAVGIRFSDGSESSILYRQKRLGKDGKPFFCYKFRTMMEKNEQILEEYLARHPEERQYYLRYHKYRNDPRITPIGRYLRKLSLDELPQIFNVLKGEMSFVGPRPYMLEESALLAEAKASILSVKPGITGLWQVSGRNRLDFSQRIAIDLWYIRNWSLWLDGVILAKTVKTVLKREGAY